MFLDHPWDLGLLNQIGKHLQVKKHTVAVAESVTAGYLQVALSFAENASRFFEGGITTYSVWQKAEHLGIDKREAEACNAVSASIALQMAEGVRRLFHTNWGIAITGYATPVPESGNTLFAFYCIIYDGRVAAAEKITVENLTPARVRLFYITKILDRFLKEMESITQ